MEILRSKNLKRKKLVSLNIYFYVSFLLLFGEISPAFSQNLDCVKAKITPQESVELNAGKGETNNDPVYDSLRQYIDLDISPSDDGISACILKSDGVRIINLNPSSGTLNLSSRVGNTDVLSQGAAALRAVCAFSPDSSQVFAIGSGSPEVGLDRIYPFNVNGATLSRVQEGNSSDTFTPSDLATALAVAPGKKYLVYVQNNSTSHLASIQSVEIKGDNSLEKSFIGQDLASVLDGGSYIEFGKDSGSSKFAFGAFSDLQQGIPGSGKGFGIFKTNLSTGVNFILKEFKKGSLESPLPDGLDTPNFVGISGVKFIKRGSDYFLFVSYFENDLNAGFGDFSYITKLALLKVNIRNEVTKTTSLNLVGKPILTVFKTPPCSENSFHGISGPLWVNDSILYLADNNNESFFATYSINWDAINSADSNTEIITLSSFPVLTNQNGNEKNTDIVSTLSNKFAYVGSSNISGDPSAKIFGYSIEESSASCKNLTKTLGLCELLLSKPSLNSDSDTSSNNNPGTESTNSSTTSGTVSSTTSGTVSSTTSGTVSSTTSGTTTANSDATSSTSSSSTTSGTVYQPPIAAPYYPPSSVSNINTGRPSSITGSGRPINVTATPRPIPTPPKIKPRPSPTPKSTPEATPNPTPTLDIKPPSIDLNAIGTTTLSSDSSQFIDVKSLDLKGSDQVVIPPLIPRIVLSEALVLPEIEIDEGSSPKATASPAPESEISIEEVPITTCCSCDKGNLVCNKNSTPYCDGGNVKCVGPENMIISCCRSLMGVEQCNGDDPTIKCLNPVTKSVKLESKTVSKVDVVKLADKTVSNPENKIVDKSGKTPSVDQADVINNADETLGLINAGSAGVLINLSPGTTLKSKDIKNVSQLIIDKDSNVIVLSSANFLSSPNQLLSKLVLPSDLKVGVNTLVTVINQGGGKKKVIAKSPIKVFDSYQFSNIGDESAKDLPKISKIDGRYVGESKKGGSIIRLTLYGNNFASKSVKVGSQSFHSGDSKTLTTFSLTQNGNIEVIRTRVLKRGKRMLITLRYTGSDDLSGKSFTLSTPKGHIYYEKLGIKLNTKKPVRSVILDLDNDKVKDTKDKKQ